MGDAAPTAHPYMANSVPAIKRQMLEVIGAATIAELFEQIPADHRVTRAIELPRALSSETELRRHMTELLARNQSCEEMLSFLGGGCWQHYVPAVVDEIVGRSEFLTPVWGTPSSDHGRNQAWFEFTSQIGELLEMDFVGLPVYSWGCAAGFAIRMASRLTDRREVLVQRTIDPERLAVIRNFCQAVETPDHITIVLIDEDPATGRLDVADLARKISVATAAVYFDTPSYLGVIETAGADIAEITHAVDAELIVGVDPISLGVLAPPASFGADIVVGTMQPLGVHMNCGGGTGGFIASRDEERYAREYPTLLVSITDTIEPGERGFGLTLFGQSSYGARERGKDWTGTSVYLWAIANAAYMAMLGPDGFAELGEVITCRTAYAARRLADVPGVRIVHPSGFFKEFVVNFDAAAVSVEQVNAALYDRGIFGGKDLSDEFPEYGQSALYCVTEIHTQADIDRLVDALQEVVAG